MRAIVAAVLLLLLPSSQRPAVAQGAPVLVELFTSQGCSSCPPADALLGELAQRRDVVALAFHVTYWDRLGWKDSFAAEAWTDRQRGYAALVGTHGVYTPQMVVGGRLDVVGSDRRRVLAAVDLARSRAPAAAITFDDHGRAQLPTVSLGRPARLLRADFTDLAEVDIGRGENAGRTIAYHRVVRALADVGPWDGQARSLEVPVGGGGFALIAQDPASGAVVALGQRPP
jgi:hypothetical protein